MVPFWQLSLLHLKIRKIISVFLLLVLSAQLLPLRQTIRWLLSGQSTEELAHASDDDSGRPGDDLQKHFLPVYSPALDHGIELRSARVLLILTEELPGIHADDIPTPPPNC
jgi:hypothetical protein